MFNINEIIIFQAENVSRENVVDSLKVIILFLLSAILPTDLLTWMSYAIGAGAASTLLRYPYERSLEEEADKVPEDEFFDEDGLIRKLQ